MNQSSSVISKRSVITHIEGWDCVEGELEIGSGSAVRLNCMVEGMMGCGRWLMKMEGIDRETENDMLEWGVTRHFS